MCSRYKAAAFIAACRWAVRGRCLPAHKVADRRIAARLGTTLAAMRHLREHRPDLWDADVNGWLHGNDLASYPPTTGRCAAHRKRASYQQ